MAAPLRLTQLLAPVRHFVQHGNAVVLALIAALIGVAGMAALVEAVALIAGE
jgi:hypothetical protein